LIGAATVPTPRKNRRGLPDSHGVPFTASALGQAIVDALGGATGQKALAATHEALMGFPPTHLGLPLSLMETQFCLKQPKPSVSDFWQLSARRSKKEKLPPPLKPPRKGVRPGPAKGRGFSR
jgi:hypothetical protein